MKKKTPPTKTKKESALLKGAKLTNKELAFVNKIGQQAMDAEQRPLVYIALCGAILENIMYSSGGRTDKKTLMKFIDLATPEVSIEDILEHNDKIVAKEPGKCFGKCDSCGTKTVLVKEVHLCGPCCFGEADTINGNW